MVKEFIKSLSNTSTTSVESGIYDMDDLHVGAAVEKILVEAQHEKRVICGLNEASKYLNDTEHPEHSLFFFIAPSKAGDSVTHMQEVFLQAFCFENDIYIIQLDSADKLNRILDSPKLESCALICVNPSGDSDCEGSFLDQDYQMTKIENRLVDYCEDHWNDSQHSLIRLPEK